MALPITGTTMPNNVAITAIVTVNVSPFNLVTSLPHILLNALFLYIQCVNTIFYLINVNAPNNGMILMSTPPNFKKPLTSLSLIVIKLHIIPIKLMIMGNATDGKGGMPINTPPPDSMPQNNATYKNFSTMNPSSLCYKKLTSKMKSPSNTVSKSCDVNIKLLPFATL